MLRSSSGPRASNDNSYSESVPHGQVPSRLPRAVVHQQGGDLRVGGGLSGLVQPPAPPQRDHVRHAPSASQRGRHRELPAARPSLREGPPEKSTPLEPIQPLLAPDRGGVDQQATRRAGGDSSTNIINGKSPKGAPT